jgi:hypothetical protein
MSTQATELLAVALEAAADHQSRGAAHRIGEARGRTLEQILEVDRSYSEPISFALGFWDEWADAASRRWRGYDAGANDWLRFAHEVARAVRRDTVPKDLRILGRLIWYPETLRQRVRRLWGVSLKVRARV